MSQDNNSVARIEATVRVGQSLENTRIAEAHLAALNARDIAALRDTLHPEVHITGPAGEVHTRESFLETYGKVFANIQRAEVTARLEHDNQTFSIYNLIFTPPIPPARVASLMTYESGKIKKIEMVHDTHLFQKFV